MEEDDCAAVDEMSESDATDLYSESKTLLSQGAEARVYRCLYLGCEAVVKERFEKRYRHPELNKRLTKERIKNEFRATVKCKQIGIDVPTVYFMNVETNAIIFEYINGPTVKCFIEQTRQAHSRTEFEEIMCMLGRRIGCIIGGLHSSGISHGDLTTSNIILRDADPKRVCLIDFGLSSSQITIEDCGVDLYVLERAVRTTHSDIDCFMKEIVEGYLNSGWSSARLAISKFGKVRLRGRKRNMTG